MPNINDFMRDPLGEHGVEPWVKAAVASVIPVEWEKRPSKAPYSNFYKHLRQPMYVLVGGEKLQLGDLYVHMQVSRTDRELTMEELREVKDVFFGPNTACYQILVPRENLPQLGQFCIHLWMRAWPGGEQTRFHVPSGRDEQNIIERSKTTERLTL